MAFAEKQQEQSIDLLNQKINATSEDCIPKESSVDLFYKEWPFSNENLVIIDTPGIDVDDEIDKDIAKECKDADLVVLVIDSVTAITKTMKKFLIDSKTIFSKLNCVLVYNQWDQVPQDSKSRIKQQHRQVALDILCRELNADPHLAEQRIFFLSAKNEMENIPNISNKNNDECFDYIRIKLQTELRASFEKRLECLRNFGDFVKRNNASSECLIRAIKNKIPQFSVKFSDKLRGLNDLQGKMKESMDLIFEEGYELYIKESLNKINDKISPEETENYVNRQFERDHLQILGLTESDQNELQSVCEIDLSNVWDSQEQLLPRDTLDVAPGQDLNDEDKSNIKNKRIEMIFTKIFGETIQKLKSKMTEIIKEQNCENVNDQILAIEEIFFPLYAESSTPLMDNNFTEILRKMKKKLNVATGVTIGLSAVTGLAGLATGGVAFGILIPVQIAMRGLVGFGVAGGAVGASVLGGTANGVIKFIKRPFQFVTKRDEKPIKEQWDLFKTILFDNYCNFMEKIENDLIRILRPLEDEFDEIQNQMIEIREEIQNLVSQTCHY